MRVASLSVALSLVLFAALSLTTPRAGAAGMYTVTDIGTLVGAEEGQFDELVSIQPGAINAEGVVVATGISLSADARWAVIFTSQDGEVTRIGGERATTFGYDINDQGDVAGYRTSRDDTALANAEATVWRGGKPEALPSLGGDRCLAIGINNNGDVVGSSTLVPGNTTTHAVLWRGGEPIDLGTLGGSFSFAQKINEPGQVVGLSTEEGDASQAPFVWEDGKMTALSVRDGFSGTANGINDDGLVVGGMFRTVDTTNGINEFFAVKWTDGERERLPALIDEGQGNTAAVNSNGDIVGWSALSDQGNMDAAAVLWRGDEIVDLNTVIPEGSGFRLNMSTSINDAGQIVVSAIATEDNSARAVVLNPVDESASHIGVAFVRVPIAALKQ